MLALLQAEQDKQLEVVFDKLCCTCEPILHWTVEGGICMFERPPGVSGSQVRQALVSMVEFDCAGEFPQQSELFLKAGDSRSNWLVSLAGRGGRIILKRLQ